MTLAYVLVELWQKNSHLTAKKQTGLKNFQTYFSQTCSYTGEHIYLQIENLINLLARLVFEPSSIINHRFAMRKISLGCFL